MSPRSIEMRNRLGASGWRVPPGPLGETQVDVHQDEHFQASRQVLGVSVAPTFLEPVDYDFRVLLAVEGRATIGPLAISPGQALVLRGDLNLASALGRGWAWIEWQLNSSALRTPVLRNLTEKVQPAHSVYWEMLTAATMSLLNAPMLAATRSSLHLGRAMEQLVVAALLSSEEADPPNRADTPTLYRAAQTLIALKFKDQSFTVEALAKSLHVSTSRLHRAFATAGTTPRREIERHRIARAQEQLQPGRTNAARAERVAQSSGFRSRTQMLRAIRRASRGTVGV
ncbi:helix-turn-helix domain-containing protein [Leucobacter sp. wl10]|uniref:helix-turn-helix domain-containing protein n=1 Tax=Leucobacter sp. wl10 TaxID=2304677 RepID=UPI000E5AED8F|nr:helix-turn-helix domain-containing protein [Leucobacter sp. wl10]RGE24313.1 helix-turn-helix domain-containing protein [Leucobacter sp. wl10]